MSLYRRKDSSFWWISLTINGHHIQKSTRTTNKKIAQELHDTCAADLWRQANGLKKKRTWQEAVDRYTREKAHLSSIDDIKRHLRFWGEHLGHIDLSNITTGIVADVNLDLSVANANRHRATLKTLFNAAHKKWDWLDRVPVISLETESTERVRWITRDEADNLITALPEYLRDAAELSLQTGLRQQNVLGLRWNQIDMARKTAWIHPDEAKGKTAIGVPLNNRAVEIIRGRIGHHNEFVFTNTVNNRIQKISADIWRKALEKSGIEDFKWHDLRHTWASWHVMSGTSLQKLKELGGWKSLDLVLRYAHLSTEHLADAAAAPLKMVK